MSKMSNCIRYVIVIGGINIYKHTILQSWLGTKIRSRFFDPRRWAGHSKFTEFTEFAYGGSGAGRSREAPGHSVKS